MRFAINPLQWYQQPDGSLDFGSKPALPRVLAEVKEAGFDAMHAELWADVPDDEYPQLFAAADVAPAPGYFSFLPTSGDVSPQVLSAAQHQARRHVALGLDHIFLAVDGVPSRNRQPAIGAPVDVPLADRVAQIDQVAQVFAAAGVTPCFHQHVGTVIETEAELRAVLAGSASCALGPDLGHLVWAGIDPLALMADYRDRIGAMHIKDCHTDVVRGALSDGSDYLQSTVRGIWAELGDGDLPLAEALNLAGSATEDMWVIVEVDHTTKPTPLDSARECARWVATWKENNA